MYRAPSCPYSDSDSVSEPPLASDISNLSYATAHHNDDMSDVLMAELSGTSSALRHVLPPLREFNGSRTDYPIWRAALTAKLAVDGLRMGGPYGTIATIMFALKGHAERLCSPTIARLLSTPGSTAAEATAYLDKIFDDPQRQQNALKLWGKLSQGTTSFDVFYAEFERLLAEAGGEAFDERVKISQLQDATNNEIVRLGFSADNCKTVQELANLYRKISVGLASLKAPRTAYATPYAVTSSAASPASAHHTNGPGCPGLLRRSPSYCPCRRPKHYTH
jgi:hypothetical protein